MNKVVNALAVALLVPVLGAASLAGCGDDDDDSKGPGEQGGSAGSSAGSGGAAGTASGGTGGSAGGTAKSGGTFYDLAVAATGFSPHVNNKVFAALVRLSDESVIAEQPITLVGGDTFSFTWNGVLRDGGGYALDYYADVNNDNTCNPPSTDHVWRRPIPTPTTDTTLSFAHDTDWTNHCASFNSKPARHDLSFTATGFGAVHPGATLQVAVVRADTSDVIARKQVAPIPTDGDIKLAWTGLLEEGVKYNVDYYVDVNKTGSCDDPPADHVWRHEVPATTTNVDVSVPHTSDWGKYCDSFNK